MSRVLLVEIQLEKLQNLLQQLTLHCHLKPLVPPVVIGFNYEASNAKCSKFQQKQAVHVMIA